METRQERQNYASRISTNGINSGAVTTRTATRTRRLRREAAPETSLPQLRSSTALLASEDEPGEELSNTASQTEGLYNYSGMYQVWSSVDALTELRSAKESFLRSSAVRYILEYLRETDSRPKTGYTYATGVSHDILGDPNPPMPNMSRYSLDHYSRFSEEGGYDYSFSHSSTSSSDRMALRSSDRSAWNSPSADASASDYRSVDMSASDLQRTSWAAEMSRSYRIFREFLTTIYRRVTTTITNTNITETDAANGYSSKLTKNLSRTARMNGRITPESRSGNDHKMERQQDRSAYLSSATRLSSSFVGSRSKDSNDYGSSRPNTPVSSSSGTIFANKSTVVGAATARLVSPISRRFIDVITQRFTDIISTTTTVNHGVDYDIRCRDEDPRSRKSRSWCLPCLLLLFLLPILFAGWALLSDHLKVNEGFSRGGPVITNWFQDTSGSLYAINASSEKSANVTNSTTIPSTVWIQERIIMPKDCCQDVELIKSQVAQILIKLEDIRKDQSQRTAWENNREIVDEQTRLTVAELRNILIRLEKEINVRDQIVPKVVRERESFSLEDVRMLVTGMIRRYDEDKMGEPDHALETAGATVISTRCTEEHKWGYAQYSLFGFPLWSWTTTPRLAIQPEIKPGQCWAFKGDQGYLVIKLAGLVHPTSVTIEHLPKNLSPTGRIDSAPKDFEVYGLRSEQGPGILLGKFAYEDNGQSLQNFQVQTRLEPEDLFPIVELRITSNHGNPEYTCLYRFRVHGILVKRGSF